MEQPRTKSSQNLGKQKVNQFQTLDGLQRNSSKKDFLCTSSNGAETTLQSETLAHHLTRANLSFNFGDLAQ
jgi:hypothetical protein